MPVLVFAELDEGFGRTEGDDEIQGLLQREQRVGSRIIT